MEDTPQTPVAETPAATVDPTAAVATEPTVATAPVAAAATPVQPVATTTEMASPSSADTAPAAAGLSNGAWTGIGLAVVLLVVLVALFAKRGKQGGGARSREGGAAPSKSNGDVVEIYVGNLSYDMTEAQFRKEFEKFGVVKSARIIGHRTSGKSKGYGFVEMPHRKEALVAIKALNNRDVMGRKLRVNEARNGTREE